MAHESPERTPSTMYERSYGSLHDPDRTAKEDAANIRRHVRTMTKAGVLPADWAYSVRYTTAAMCRAIDVRATSPRPIYAVDPEAVRYVGTPAQGAPVQHPETGEWVTAHRDTLTVEAAAVLATLTDLHDGHNHDGSESQVDYFDVKFYGQVSLDVAPGVDRVLGAGGAVAA